MIAYIAQRILSLLFVLFLATVVIFAMMHSVPGGPFDFTQGNMTPAALHNIQVKYGLADRSGGSTSTGSGSYYTVISASRSSSRP